MPPQIWGPPRGHPMVQIRDLAVPPPLRTQRRAPHPQHHPGDHRPVRTVPAALAGFVVAVLVVGHQNRVPGGEVAQDALPVAPPEPPPEELGPARKKLLGQQGHGGGRKHLALQGEAARPRRPRHRLQRDLGRGRGGAQEGAPHPQSHQPALGAVLDQRRRPAVEKEPEEVGGEALPPPPQHLPDVFALPRRRRPLQGLAESPGPRGGRRRGGSRWRRRGGHRGGPRGGGRRRRR